MVETIEKSNENANTLKMYQKYVLYKNFYGFVV